jgi:hypothetical protein
MFYVFFFLFLISVFSFINIDKDRIIWCAFLPGIIAFIYLKIEYLKNILYSNWMFFLLIISSLFLFSSQIDFRFSKFYLNNRITVLEELDNCFEEPFVSWIGFESENIFLSPSKSRKAIMMGWFSGTPHNIDKIHKLCNCDNINGIYGIKNGKLNWVFSLDDVSRINMVKNFYKQHYNSPKMNVNILKLKSGYMAKVLTINFN